MQRIVITSCSQRKKSDKHLLPAIERYDGPNFRLLRKYLSQSTDKLDIYVLSAKFGLLAYTTEIPFYEQKLSNQQFHELTEISRLQANQFFTETEKPKEVFVNLGSSYLQVFEPTLEKLAQTNSLTFTSGSSGKRLAEMHDWLYGANSPLRNERAETKSEEVFIQGIRLQTSENEIRAIIQNEVAQNKTKDLQNFQSWFVPIDDIKVSPKWLISKLTGLPVGKFHSDQARKVLQRLGIKVERV
jgi:hypothetical protein